MNIKFIFAIISVVIGIIAFMPYLINVLSRKTQPHAFTWLIWSLTQGTATAGLWYGGGGFGAISLTISTILVTLMFLLSLSHGSKDITKSDIIVLTAALSAILIWWLLENPILAIALVSIIDLLGYIPTFRKSYNQPWSETAMSWGTFTIGNIFAILALGAYNFLTLSYLISIATANSILLVFLLIRRHHKPKPTKPSLKNTS